MGAVTCDVQLPWICNANESNNFYSIRGCFVKVANQAVQDNRWRHHRRNIVRPAGGNGDQCGQGDDPCQLGAIALAIHNRRRSQV